MKLNVLFIVTLVLGMAGVVLALTGANIYMVPGAILWGASLIALAVSSEKKRPG